MLTSSPIKLTFLRLFCFCFSAKTYSIEKKNLPICTTSVRGKNSGAGKQSQ